MVPEDQKKPGLNRVNERCGIPSFHLSHKAKKKPCTSLNRDPFLLFSLKNAEY